jgi:multidrug resistance efflux pump
MSSAELKSELATQGDGSDAPRRVAADLDNAKSCIRIAPILITLGTVAIAVFLAWATWQVYMGAPWTRDGTVRAYVVTMAPEVAGRIVKLPVADNQFVHKGDVLFEIDPADYRIALSRRRPRRNAMAPRSIMPARTRIEKPRSRKKVGPRQTFTSKRRARCINRRGSSPWTRQPSPRRSSISVEP